MTSDASVQRRNMESAILFMQKEHAATLTALHEEIHALQSRCTDLTFQLTMNCIDIEEGGTADTRLADIQSQLQASQMQKERLESQLMEQTGRVEQLTQELRSQKKHHLDELRAAEKALSSLQAETEAKANSIAYLTTQLHHLKLKPEAFLVEEGVLQGQGPQHIHLPVPPRDLINSAHLRHQTGGLKPRSGTRRVGTIRTGSATVSTPDISPFVHRDLQVSVATPIRKPSQPLPPITGSRVSSGREVHHLLIASGGPLTRATVPEVATLAVDQIHSSSTIGVGASWKTLPPTQSHPCQHNQASGS